jgi:putative flippase GtrA
VSDARTPGAGPPLPRWMRQFLRYTGVGAVGTACQYAVLWIGVEQFGSRAAAASAVGAVAGAAVNYLLNYYYTFGGGVGHAGAAPRFFAVAAVGVAINTGIMHVLADRLGVYYWLAQLVATGAVLVTTFLANKVWTFSRGHRV